MTEKKVVEVWENWSKKRSSYPVYDNWLDTYHAVLENHKKDMILDLGCGIGADTAYLLERGYSVLSADLSYEALANIERKLPKSKTLQMDMTVDFPIADESYSLIIADLCLHYFSVKDMIHVMKEIKRILKPNGILLARVARVDDYDYGAGVGEKIEKNYYFEGSYYKRFFEEEDIQKYFSMIGSISYRKTEMTRDEECYTKPKKLYEVKVMKGDGSC